MPFQIAGQQFKDRANREACFFKMISENYFHALGIQLKKGRMLTGKDVKGSPPVVVVNETMVKRFFKDEDPIGKRILVQEIVFGKPQLGPEIPWEVVGVIADGTIHDRVKASAVAANSMIGAMAVVNFQIPPFVEAANQVAPSALAATARSACSWPRSVNRRSPVSTLQTWATLSLPTTTR